MVFLADVIKLNGYSDDVSVAVDKAIKPTILAKDDSMADNGVIDMAPNSIVVGNTPSLNKILSSMSM
jgi:hypothetical protein